MHESEVPLISVNNHYSVALIVASGFIGDSIFNV